MAASASPHLGNGESARRLNSLTQAAAVLGVHRNTLSKWIDEGCPVVTRADRDRGIEWEIDVGAVVNWRITRAVEDAVAAYQDEDGGHVTKDQADRRRAVANAITAEVEADEALKSVVSLQDARQMQAEFCQVLKTGLSNASSRIAARATSMTVATEIEDICHAELNRAFASARQELISMWAVRGIDQDDLGEA